MVGEASDGEEAVAAADRLRPAVVVIDINMPRMNGIEATAVMKRRFPHMLVIGLSVNAGGENQQAMKEAGAVLLLTKEAAVEQLYKAIWHVMTEGKEDKETSVDSLEVSASAARLSDASPTRLSEGTK